MDFAEVLRVAGGLFDDESGAVMDWLVAGAFAWCTGGREQLHLISFRPVQGANGASSLVSGQIIPGGVSLDRILAHEIVQWCASDASA